MADLPTISIVIPTYNCAAVLRQCLESVRAQVYPKDRLELLVMDGGSTDGTQEAAHSYGATVVERSEERDNPERRKALGLHRAGGDFILYIDSDNILPHPKWLVHMVEPLLEDPEIIASQPSRYHYDPSYSLMNRYFALFGFTDPVAHYLQKADRLSWADDSWNLMGEAEDMGRYYKVRFNPEHVPTIGANGHLVRRGILLKAQCDPDHFFHIDVNLDLIRMGYDTYAFIKDDIVHLTSSTFSSYVLKRIAYMRHYYLRHHSARRYRLYSPEDRWRLLRYILYSLTMVEPFAESLRGYVKVRDRAWFLHPFLCLAFTFAYGLVTIEWALRSALGRG